MTYNSTEEQQGARARPTRKEDASATPVGLRALTWVGVVFVAAAVFVLTVPLQTPHATDAGYPPILGLDPWVAVVAVLLACTGVVVLAVRIAAGAVIRSIGAREASLPQR
jgi:hypothetical protein